MGDFFSIFEKSQIFVLTFRDGRVINMNPYTKSLLSPPSSVVEYIMDTARHLKIFDVILNNGIYRLIRIKLNNETLILGFNITDLKEKEKFLRKEKMENERRIEELVALSDLVIHDIKNYLFMLDGYVDILKESYSYQYIQEIEKIIGAMRELVGRSSILIKNPERFRRKQRIDLKTLLDSVIEKLEDTANKKKVALLQNYKSVGVSVDPIIEEAFLNVIHNAIKFSPEGGEVKIIMEKYKDNVVISITDNGPGISGEYKSAIFDRFKRGSSGIGMGLGLATAKYLIEANDGRIWVEDNKPQGSIFKIQLPRK